MYPTCFHVLKEIYESCLEREEKCIYQFGTITWNITGLFVTFYFLFSFAGEIRAAMSEGTNGSARSYISPVQFFLYFVVGKINLRHKIIIFYLVKNLLFWLLQLGGTTSSATTGLEVSCIMIFISLIIDDEIPNPCALLFYHYLVYLYLKLDPLE